MLVIHSHRSALLFHHKFSTVCVTGCNDFVTIASHYMHMKRRITDQILLLKIRHGDAQAFAELYDCYVDQLFRFVSYRVREQELAQDLTSELFLKVWQLLSQVEAKAKVDNLQAYLYQVARNLIADHYRSHQETLPLEEAIEVRDRAPGPAENTQQRLSLDKVEQGIKQLPAEWQEVVILAHVEGIPPREIAVIINKSSAATRVILHRALAELRKILDSQI